MLRFLIKNYLSFKKIREKYKWISTFTFRKWLKKKLLVLGNYIYYGTKKVLSAQGHTCWILWTEFMNLSCLQSVHVHSSRIVCLLYEQKHFLACGTPPWPILHSAWIVCLLYEQKHFLACDTMTHCDRSCCFTSLSTYNVLSFSVTSLGSTCPQILVSRQDKKIIKKISNYKLHPLNLVQVQISL